MSDAPIDARDFISGVNVVDIGEIRVARGLTRRPYSTCRHLRMTYCDKERRIWCRDCETEVEPYDAFKGVCENLGAASAKLERREQALKDAETFQARSKAVKVMDDVWRSRTMAPMCPHCSEAILPEDVAHGVKSTGKKMAQAKRERDKK